MINILVTGGNGQLAKCIKDLENTEGHLKFIYTDYQELDISDIEAVETFFKNNHVDYCMNYAAYTAVDQAQNDPESAIRINKLGAKNLAIECQKYNSTLIHISTDFVFNGKQTSFYKEDDAPNPISVYGVTKLQGEIEIQNHLTK